MRYLSLGGASLLWVGAVLAFKDPLGHFLHEHWGWRHYSYGHDLFTRRLFTGMLPVPIAFLLWLRQLEQEGPQAAPLAARFSPIAAGISLSCLIALAGLQPQPVVLEAFLALGVGSALFVRLPALDWCKAAMAHPRLGVIALLCGEAAWLYYRLMASPVSHVLLRATAWSVTAALGLAGIDVFTTENMDYPLAFDMITPRFRIILAPFCGGLEGMFLFVFMWSAVLLLDWERFRALPVALIYAAGLLAAFGLNVLRICALFTLGYVAGNPAAPAWVQQLQRAPFALFHSYAGWLLDLSAFALFTAWLYRKRAA